MISVSKFLSSVLLVLTASAVIGSCSPAPADDGASAARAATTQPALSSSTVAPSGSPDISAYRGLGSWVDIFEKAYKHPASTVAAMKAKGVRTIYIETSNYSHGADIIYPTMLGKFIDAAHANGMQVEGWYLPAFTNIKKDLRKSRAAIEFTSPGGDHLDSFGLDIESPLVRRPALRTGRLLALSAQIRAAAGDGYPLGAITPNPVRLQTEGWFWPRFPYAKLAALYDVFVPMDYLSYDVSGRVKAHNYTAKGIRLIKAGTGDPSVPIHVIGGISGAMPASEDHGFLDAAQQGGVIGASLYNFSETSAADWRVMGKL